MSRFHTRKALGISAASLATLTLVPLLAPAGRTERLTLLMAAVPVALLLGAVAGWTPPAPRQAPAASSAAHTVASTGFGDHAPTHLHAHDHPPSTDPGRPPQDARVITGALKPRSVVEELQHTLPR